MSDLSDLARKRVAVAAYYFVPGLVFASWALSRRASPSPSCRASASSVSWWVLLSLDGLLKFLGYAWLLV